MNQKILAIIKSDKGKFLLLKTNPKWLQVDEWFVVTGSVEGKESFGDAARREIAEETGLQILNLIETDYSCEYEWPVGSGKMHFEKGFLAIVKHAEPKLSGEHLEYKWLSEKEFISKIAWTGDKKELRKLLI